MIALFQYRKDQYKKWSSERRNNAYYRKHIFIIYEKVTTLIHVLGKLTQIMKNALEFLIVSQARILHAKGKVLDRENHGTLKGPRL